MNRSEIKKLILPALLLLIALIFTDVYIKGSVTGNMIMSLVCDELCAFITYYIFVYRKNRGTNYIWLNYILWTLFFLFSEFGNYYGWF